MTEIDYILNSRRSIDEISQKELPEIRRLLDELEKEVRKEVKYNL